MAWLCDSLTFVVASVDLDNRELRFDLGGSGHGKKRTPTQEIKGPAKEDRRGRKSEKKPTAKKKQKTFKEKPKHQDSANNPGKKKSNGTTNSNSGRGKKKR